MPMRSFRAALALLCAGLHFPIQAAPEPPPTPTREEWYQITFGGGPAGYMMERESPQAGGVILTETILEISLSRGDADLTMTFENRFLETEDGHPLRVESRQVLARLPVTFTWTFAADHILLRSTQGDSVQETRLPLFEGPWLTPAAVAREVSRQVSAGAESFHYRTLDPTAGPTPVEVEAQRLGEDVRATPTGPVKASRWQEVVRGTATLESVVWRDETGRMLETRTQLMGLELTTTASDRETALGKGEKGKAPELLMPTFVRPSRPIPAPRDLERAVYRLSLPAGDLPPLLTAGGQRSEPVPGGVRITVVAAGAGEGEEVADTGPYLAATTYLNHRDEGVRRLAEEALLRHGAELPNQADEAETLRDFVHHYLIHKDLATGFATAAEVVKTRSGDCTEHAVLLAALLRAVGIPSRVVGGLLYVEAFAGGEEIFGYHMWTQALLEKRWVDLDAMTPEPFDAAHIALAATALDDTTGLSALGGVLISMIGALEVEVVELGLAAEAPAGAEPGSMGGAPESSKGTTNDRGGIHHDGARGQAVHSMPGRRAPPGR